MIPEGTAPEGHLRLMPHSKTTTRNRTQWLLLSFILLAFATLMASASTMSGRGCFKSSGSNSSPWFAW